MRRTMLVVGILVAGGVAAEARASSLGDLALTSVDSSSGAVVETAAPPAPADFIVPPHLAAGLPTPPGWAFDLKTLPTFQDLVAASPTYTAPPPIPQRVRRR